MAVEVEVVVKLGLLVVDISGPDTREGKHRLEPGFSRMALTLERADRSASPPYELPGNRHRDEILDLDWEARITLRVCAAARMVHEAQFAQPVKRAGLTMFFRDALEEI